MKPQISKKSFCTSLVAVGGLLLLATNNLRGADVPPGTEGAESKTVQFVYIGGEVKIPQRCVYTNGMTLVTAIKSAGGVTDLASPTQVKLTRGKDKPMMFDRRKIEGGTEQDIKLQPDDKIFVPRQK